MGTLQVGGTTLGVKNTGTNKVDLSNVGDVTSEKILTKFIGFDAYLGSASGNITANAWHEIGSGTSNFGSNKWTKNVDPQTEFDADTGRYTPQQAGMYLFAGSLSFGRLDDGQNMYCTISKNNGHANPDFVGIEREFNSLTNQGLFCSMSGIMQANGSSDFFSMKIYQNYGTREVGYAKFGAYFLGTI
tara:strand:- start:746 stop:1309 length:564 start_codon:yes stop_codon:yes gene_type:complete